MLNPKSLLILVTVILHNASGQGCIPNEPDPGLVGAFVPRCDTNGNYAVEQCHGSTGFCWCVTTDGNEIPNTRIPPGNISSSRRNCVEERFRFTSGVYRQPMERCYGAYEEFSPCGAACTVGCDSMNTNVACSGCTPGCVCQAGYVRRVSTDPSTPCIARAQCFNSGYICADPNSQFMQCLPNCEETCSYKPLTCSNECRRSGCACRPGYVKLTGDVNAICVQRASCYARNVDPDSKCQDRNSIFTNCGSSCPETCEGKQRACAQICIQGCFCKPGYVKESSNPNARCIKPYQCNANPPNQCSDLNSYFSQCGTACPETCAGSAPSCSLNCVQGCFCNPGYVRENSGANARCVRKDQCPALPSVCTDPNAVYSQCGTACEESCTSSQSVCTSACVRGCFCRPGYVRESAVTNARCVPRASCASRPTTYCADPNSQFLDCGTACPETCQYTPTTCTFQCVQGCFCRTGYVKESSATNARCVLRQACASNPVYCSDPNAEYLQCGTACQETCQFAPTTCSLQCIQGCFCKAGYVKHSSSSNARCVLRQACASNPGYCSDPNSQYSTCGSACPETCQLASSCSLQCVSGCFCKPGYVKFNGNSNALCVTRLQCPGLGTVAPKIGTCPIMQTDYAIRRREDLCVTDNDCNAQMKCCNTLTGFICLMPENKPTDNRCNFNEVYVSCTSPCAIGCDNYLNINCPAICGPPGCQCVSGFVKSMSTDSQAVCVPTAACSKPGG